MRAYLFAKTGGAHGWINELAATSGVKRQTLSGWMGDRTQPDLASLEAVASAISVRTFELVAAMDGDVAVSLLDPAVRAALREEIEAALDERLGHRGEDAGRGSAA